MQERSPPIRPKDPACTAAWSRISEFVTKPLAREENVLLREHLEVCADCRMRYDTAVETAAVIGRRRRVERLEERRARRRGGLRRAAIEAAFVGGSGRRSLFRLRTILLPAFFAFLMVCVARLVNFGPPPPVVNAEWIQGEVRAADRLLGPEERPQTYLHVGEWCATGEDSSALLSAAEVTCAVGSSTLVKVESTRPARFRLERGYVALEGPATVSTSFGVAALAGGRVELVAAEDALELFCQSGGVTFTDVRGTRQVPPGGRVRIER